MLNSVTNYSLNNNVVEFNFNGYPIRAIKQGVIGNKPWLVGKDITKALMYKQPSKAVQDHVSTKDQYALIYNLSADLELRSLFGKYNHKPVALITKQGVFDLIIHSHAPNAKKFQHWLTHDVLPKISKTGNYISNPVNAIKYGMSKLNSNQTNLLIANQLKQLSLSNMAKDKHIKKLTNFKNQFNHADKSVHVDYMGKIVVQNGFPSSPTAIYPQLRYLHILGKGHNKNIPSSTMVSHKYFSIHESPFQMNGGKTSFSETPKVSPTGQSYVLEVFAKSMKKPDVRAKLITFCPKAVQRKWNKSSK